MTNSHALLLGIKILDILEDSAAVFTKLNIFGNYQGIALLGTYPSELKMYGHTKIHTQIFVADLFLYL